MKDYVGVLNGGTYNNISINYLMYDINNPNTNAHLYWGTATVNNSLHEFHDYATADGINLPSDGLDILIGPSTGYGYALMDAQYVLGAHLAAGFTATFFTNPLVGLIGLVGIGGLLEYLPDIHIGVSATRSDMLKSLAYHEIAHASHFTQVGANYWTQLAASEIIANGHGDENSTNAELIGLCESWADYIGGHVYTHRTYGPDNSIPNNWDILLERTWNESQNHIPVGLYRDLADIGEPTFFRDGTLVSSCNQDGLGCTIITDNVNGFTNAQMFSSLNANMFTFSQYQNDLINNHLNATSNTVGQVNDLFNSY